MKAKIEQALNVDVAAVLGHELGDSPFDAKTLKVQENDLWPLKDKPGYYLAWGGEAEDSARRQCRPGKFYTHVLWHYGVDRAGAV